MGTQTFTSNGNWTCPAGVMAVKVECWGAGMYANENAGGGGGAYARLNAFTCTPTSVYAIVVGITNIPPNSNSTFNSTSCVAQGGGEGNTLQGGTIISSTGDVKYAGGMGYQYHGSPPPGPGGGGGGAGDAGAGSNAVGSTGGAGGSSGGGKGGDAGQDGTSAGGGGGAGGEGYAGVGAGGLVILTWAEPMVLNNLVSEM